MKLAGARYAAPSRAGRIGNEPGKALVEEFGFRAGTQKKDPLTRTGFDDQIGFKGQWFVSAAF